MSRLRLPLTCGQAKCRWGVQLPKEPAWLLWLCLRWGFLWCFERQSSYPWAQCVCWSRLRNGCHNQALGYNLGYFMICSINLPFPLNSANSKLLYIIGNKCCILSFANIPIPILLHRYQHCSCCDQHLLDAIFILMYYLIVKTEIYFFLLKAHFSCLIAAQLFCNWVSESLFLMYPDWVKFYIGSSLSAVQSFLTSERSRHKMSVIGLYDNIGCDWGT